MSIVWRTGSDTTGEGYPGPPTGLRYRVGAAGTRVLGDGWSWGLALSGQPDASPEGWQARKNELRVSRGGVEEWWAAGPLGVQQGWTVRERPVGGLRLGFRELGSLRARVVSPARLDLGDGFSFEGLHAVDARGARLPVRFVEAAGGFAIRVDDAGAVYPVTVDPWVQSATGGLDDDNFGWSVAVSGDTIVVGGAPGIRSARWAAYVFTKPAGGWASVASSVTLSATGGIASDNFGVSVAVSGDTIVVGAPGAWTSGRGKAYVFANGATDASLAVSPAPAELRRG